ncbi:JNK1/MAPK8-associated membrane protein [Orchesella cincta]|uniref:JNK1/MAPK8-associated membrane protein n=1 Tax=Orchesella cincta TaxID=48709 RepID=A0A1D2NI47_ORCCI|nr:JNK1/MAPK8-associated membrane protein [Orchesella cincta]
MSFSKVGALRYEFDRGIIQELSSCPGFYCGRTQFQDGNWSECGGCARGFRRNEFSACVPCNQDLGLYAWLYLGFMAILPLLLHFTFTDRKILKSSRNTIGLVICALIEVATAGAITLLLWEPVGQFQVKSCGVVDLSDWYPIFYNPNPNYEETIHCSYEAVYPLYTIVLVFYALADVLMVFVRLIARCFKIKVAKSIYSGLYFYPMLALGHLMFGGLVYYVFPYITIVTSVVSCAYHFASRSNQTIKALLWESISDWRNIGVIFCHWFLHAYGIISIVHQEYLYRDLYLLVLVPVPAILYILTASFTDPNKVNGD